MADLVAALLSEVVVLGVGEAEVHVSEVVSVKGKQRKLESRLKFIQPILEDAHRKQFTSRHVKDWISRVNHIIYDAEDIIDLYKVKTRDVDKARQRKMVRKQLSSLSFLCRNFLFLHNTASEINEVTKRLNMIYKEKDHYGLVPVTAGSTPAQDPLELLSRNRLTTSNITEQVCFGREEDEKLVVEWLRKSFVSEVNEKIRVMAIVGMGGLGKTTVAKQVYNNSSIKEHFEKSIWICASEKPQLLELFKQILDGLVGKGSGANKILGLDALNLEIKKHLKEKRFLLVIDDAWDSGWWAELNGLLQQGAPGSCVLITTRNEQVVVNMDARLHRLKCLPYGESWRLFVSKVLRKDEVEEKLDRVKDIARVVVEMCKGLPLALSVLGSMLKHKQRRRSDWQEVADSPFWEWGGNIVDRDDNGQILSTIALSYMNLPFHLKQCLTYCSLYPKDYPMYKEELTWLWVAEGFIPEVEGREMKICACNYLDALVGCSFIQYESDLDRYKLHDIVHDFASYMRGNENGKLPLDAKTASVQARSLCLTNFNESLINGINQHIKLRTLVLSRLSFLGRLPAGILSKAKWLRVLDLSYNTYLVELPDCLGDLVLLKHLNLCYTAIRALPESVSRLRSLETLDLNETPIEMLPKCTPELRALKHLHLRGTDMLKCTPKEIVRLKLLRTLSNFVVGSGTRESNGCSITELHDMNNLDGLLCIDHIERVQTREEAREAELHKKVKVQELKLSWEAQSVNDKQIIEKLEGIFEELQPPMGLQTLYVSYYGGTRFPAWVGSLSCLERVSINKCNLLKKLPILAHLPNLEALVISDMESLEDWSFNTHNDPMPHLRSLEIANCPKLRALPIGFTKLESLDIWNMKSLEEWHQAKTMPHLQSLEVKDCPKLRTLPITTPNLQRLRICKMGSLEEWSQIETMPCLQNLEIENCPKLKGIPDSPRLTNLHKLKMRDLPELPPTSLTSLDNIRELQLHGLAKFNLQEHRFLQLLKTATTLKGLILNGFPNLGMDSQMMGEAVEKMNQLERLHLTGCPILAASIATVLQYHHLPKLQCVHISSTDGSEYPPYPSLLSLKLDIESGDGLSGFRKLGNRIGRLIIRLIGEVDSVQEWIRHLQNLQVLVVANSPKLTHLPEWLGEFSGLQRLELADLPELRSLTDGMRSLRRLQELLITNIRGLAYLPEWLGELSQLWSLELNGLPLLGSLPDGMQPLLQLRTLKITKCTYLSHLPEWLGELSQLWSLKLEDLPSLRCLPDELDRLSMLRVLELHSLNQLRSLPEGLGTLPNLRLFRLVGMRELRRLPTVILTDKLSIFNCPLLDEHHIAVRSTHYSPVRESLA